MQLLVAIITFVKRSISVGHDVFFDTDLGKFFFLNHLYFLFIPSLCYKLWIDCLYFPFHMHYIYFFCGLYFWPVVVLSFMRETFDIRAVFECYTYSDKLSLHIFLGSLWC
jgi:hypothetical protein